jgi:DNA polymerase-1
MAVALTYNWDETIDRMDPTYVTADVEHDPRIETRIPGNGASLGVSIAGREIGTQRIIAHYYPFRHFDVNVPSATGEKLRDFINNKVQNLIMYNAKNDLVTLADLGINYTGNFYDPLLMEHWIAGKYFNMSLDTISKLHGGLPKNMSPEIKAIIDLPGKNKGWANVPYFMMKEYGINDAIITHELFLKLLPSFKKHEARWELMQEFIRYVIRMERTGIRLDKKFCENEYEYGIDVMEQIKFELELNPASPKDMEELFINRLGLKVVKKTPGGKPSFDKSAIAQYDAMLAAMNSPVAKMVKRFRGWQKTNSSNYGPYLELLGPDGRLRPNYNFHQTVTSRLSADRPALQQIPQLSPQEWNGNLRNAFIATP